MINGVCMVWSLARLVAFYYCGTQRFVLSRAFTRQIQRIISEEVKVPVSPKTDFSGLEKGSEYELLFCVIPFPFHDSNLRGIFNMSQ
jgi:hypothetical protein